MPEWARRLLVCSCLILSACASQTLEPDAPILCNDCDDWNQPQAPFRIFGNTYYVGMAGLSSILVQTSDGLILFDGGLPQSAEKIVASIRALGFDPRDVRVIAVSHAHFDHVGGIAALRRLSGAEVYTSVPSLWAMQRGQLAADDPQFDPANPRTAFPAVADADAIDDGSVFTVGDVEVRGIYTPGHTPGGITWTWQACEAQRCLQVVYADSLSPVSGGDYLFSAGLGSALAASIDRIAGLDCDILLSTHSFSFGLHRKLAQGVAAFIDDQACRQLAAAAQSRLEKRLESELRELP